MSGHVSEHSAFIPVRKPNAATHGQSLRQGIAARLFLVVMPAHEHQGIRWFGPRQDCTGSRAPNRVMRVLPNLPEKFPPTRTLPAFRDPKTGRTHYPSPKKPPENELSGAEKRQGFLCRPTLSPQRENPAKTGFQEGHSTSLPVCSGGFSWSSGPQHRPSSTRQDQKQPFEVLRSPCKRRTSSHAVFDLSGLQQLPALRNRM